MTQHENKFYKINQTLQERNHKHTQLEKLNDSLN